MYSFKDYITESTTEGAVLEEIIVSVWNGEIPPTSKTISPDAGEKIVAYLKSKHITGAKASKLKTLGVQVTPEWSNFWKPDRKSTRLNSSHIPLSRMPSSA